MVISLENGGNYTGRNAVYFEIFLLSFVKSNLNRTFMLLVIVKHCVYYYTFVNIVLNTSYARHKIFYPNTNFTV